MRPYVLGENAYVVLDGDLDISRKTEVLAALPEASVLRNVVINLTRVSYIDSFMLGSLVQFRANFIAGGGTPENLMLVLPRGGILERTFELTGLNKLFCIASLEAAPRVEEVPSGVTR
ncbi:MAG TPA: STAS domain-containing protein [Candidatus Baltobacteraceae bacterium]|jgi:anti-anti-sigma factor